MSIFKLLGAFGLLLVVIGIITRNRKKQDVLYIIGGLCLFWYSCRLGDLIFIILQTVFTLAAIWDLKIKINKK